ncbi:PIN/TRAM domain-containing protein, partial [Pedobacter sp.]|nr:PIN/TRAM domain-containing protein [Candidatus Saccharibacteria bacterium]
MDPLYFIGALIAAETTYLTYIAVRPRTTITKGSIVVDTSALIDGRIVSIVRSGFVSARLIVPSSVVRELQYMADKADHDKRERARYGLDVIQTLQSIDTIDVEIYDD